MPNQSRRHHSFSRSYTQSICGDVHFHRPALRLCQECNGTGPPIRKQKKIVDGKELRRRTVKRFLEDFGSANESEREVIDNAIRHMYSPDLKSGWGIHVVQEIKLLAKKLDRESLDSAIDELVQFGMQRKFAAETICKERCIAVEDGESWAKYMSVSGSPDDEQLSMISSHCSTLRMVYYLLMKTEMGMQLHLGMI